MIYLDNASTTQIHPEVLEAMLPYLKEEYGNAGSMHGLGRRAANAVANARQQVARLIGCKPNQIIFTSGGSEANNLVFAGLKSYLLTNGKTHIITSAVEHDSVLKAVTNICNPLRRNNENVIKSDFGATFLNVCRDCTINVQTLQNSITKQTGLVSIMYVNNETGAVNPINEIGKVCQQQGILFHTDSVQAAGFQNIDVKEIGCDFLSISSHKINAPKGIGALFAKNTSILSPMIHGGDHQEFGYRGGTENVAGIVGFGAACEITQRELDSSREKVFNLKTIFEKALIKYLERYDAEKILHINSPDTNSKIINFRFDGVDGQTLMLMLDSIGICVSAGSACRSHETKPSHVLLAMGLTEDEARNSIRVSFSQTQEPHNIIYAAKEIAQCAMILKGGI